MKYKSTQQHKETQRVGGSQKRFSQSVVNLHGTLMKTTVNWWSGRRRDHAISSHGEARKRVTQLEFPTVRIRRKYGTTGSPIIPNKLILVHATIVSNRTNLFSFRRLPRKVHLPLCYVSKQFLPSCFQQKSAVKLILELPFRVVDLNLVFFVSANLFDWFETYVKLSNI